MATWSEFRIRISDFGFFAHPPDVIQQNRGWRGLPDPSLVSQVTERLEPFTLTRMRDNSYLLDTVMNGRVVKTGYDGSTTWWDNHWFQQGAQELAGPDLAVVMRDVEFETALFDVARRDHRVQLLGSDDLDGIETIGVELTRSDDSVETWYLDPQSYLAVGRDSPGSDFGRPMTQRTFFEDGDYVHYRDLLGQSCRAPSPWTRRTWSPPGGTWC